MKLFFSFVISILIWSILALITSSDALPADGEALLGFPIFCVKIINNQVGTYVYTWNILGALINILFVFLIFYLVYFILLKGKRKNN
mgnify:CR=1 FL=1